MQLTLKQKRDKAHMIIHGAAAASAGIAGALAQGAVFGADTVALTGITAYMVISLGELFGQELTKSAAISLLGQAAGAGLGVGGAKALLGSFPGLGNTANAGITFAYTECLGWWVFNLFKGGKWP